MFEEGVFTLQRYVVTDERVTKGEAQNQTLRDHLYTGYSRNLLNQMSYDISLSCISETFIISLTMFCIYTRLPVSGEKQR